MGLAIAFATRERIVKDRQSGKTLRKIALDQNLSYSTVRNIWKRYKERGFAGLGPDYANCGPRKIKTDYKIYRSAVWLKRLHPKWGAPYIKTLLEQRYPEDAIPSARAMQLWFRQKGYNKPRMSRKFSKAEAVKGVHDCWQIDAKEKLRLLDGTQACYLTIVDVKSGAVLESPPFPPQPDLPG